MYAIGEAAKLTGLKATTIRFYETEGLVPAPARAKNGRRLYSDADVRRLAFIRHGRALGFELNDVRSLLDLADHPDWACDEANRIARLHLAEVNERLAQLSALKTELSRIARACAGGKAAQCRVIEALADRAHCEPEHTRKHLKTRSPKKPRPQRAKLRRK